jgi:hypothetical protein
MRKVRAVIIVDEGVVQTIVVDKGSVEFCVLDFDRKTLDRSCLKLLTGPFRDIQAYADVFEMESEVDKARVHEVFEARKEFYKKGAYEA